MEKKASYELINGINMGMNSIDQMIDKIESKSLREIVLNLRKDYDDLYEKVQRHYPDIDKEIKNSFIADTMLKMKTMVTDDKKMVKMLIEGSNQAVMTMRELMNDNAYIESNLRSCILDLEDISKRYIEELKPYL